MARPSNIRDEDILEAARAVFLEKGVQGTTAEVAERAGISEGSVFNRFKTKGDLFHAAMHQQLESSAWISELDSRVGKGAVTEQLYEIGLQALEFFRVVLPLSMMSWSNKPCGAPFLEGTEPPPARAIKKMSHYFEREMRAGRIRPRDPELLSRVFIGAITSFAYLETMGVHDFLPMSGETFLRGHVDVLWSGVAPRTAPPKPKKHR